MKASKIGIVVVAALIGIAIGFALRPRPTSIPSEEPPLYMDGGKSVLKEATEPARFVGVRPPDDSSLATALERDLSISAGVARWLHWLEAIERAALGDYPRLARLADGNNEVISLLSKRWAELDPRHMFDGILAGIRSGRPLPRQFEQALFTEWLKRDPGAVVAALTEGGKFREFRGVPRLVADRIFEQDVEAGLRLLSEWNFGAYWPRIEGVEKWAAAHPRHAAEFTLAHPVGHVSLVVMEAIGQEWGKSDPQGALQFAIQHRGELGSAMASGALRQWAGSDIDAAGDWLAAVDGPARTRLLPAFVQAWSQQDAESALAWSSEHLTGREQAEAIAGIFQNVAVGDASKAAAMVSAMQPGPGRTEAAATVARHLFQDKPSNQGVSQEIIQWLATLDGGSIVGVLERTTPSWAENDSQSLIRLVESIPADERNAAVIPHIYSTVARELARSYPVEALEWASRLPPDYAFTVGNETFSRWRMLQPSAALEWLSALPATDSRRDPFLNWTVESIAHEPFATAQLSALSPADRATARAIIQSMGISEERRTTLLEVIQPVP